VSLPRTVCDSLCLYAEYYCQCCLFRPTVIELTGQPLGSEIYSYLANTVTHVASLHQILTTGCLGLCVGVLIMVEHTFSSWSSWHTSHTATTIQHNRLQTSHWIVNSEVTETCVFLELNKIGSCETIPMADRNMPCECCKSAAHTALVGYLSWLMQSSSAAERQVVPPSEWDRRTDGRTYRSIA